MVKNKDDLARFGSLDVKVSDQDLKGLSWNDKLRLKQRGKLTEAQAREHGFTPVHGVGGAHTPPKGAKVAQPEPEPEPETEEEEDYSTWSKKDLQDAIDERNEFRDDDDRLARSGTIDELIDRLREDDEAED